MTSCSLLTTSLHSPAPHCSAVDDTSQWFGSPCYTRLVSIQSSPRGKRHGRHPPRQVKSAPLLFVVLLVRSLVLRLRFTACWHAASRHTVGRAWLAGTRQIRWWWTAARDTSQSVAQFALQWTHVWHGPGRRAANVCELPELRRRAHGHEFGWNLCGARRRQSWLLALRCWCDHR